MHYQIETITGQFPSEQLALRVFPTPEELQHTIDFSPINPGTIRPNSVYVGAIGCHWSAGAWQKVVDMVHFTNKHGICCWLTEFPDKCVTMPYDAIGSLRDNACTAAIDAGFEWVLLIDNDILPEPDMLMKLVNWGMAVVVPLTKDYELNAALYAPAYPPNTGLRRIRWAVLSCVLIWTRVLNCFPNRTLFTNLLIEPDFYNSLFHYGHRAFVDTNTELKLAQNPCYSGGLGTLDDKWEFLKKADVARKEKPNRRPIDPEDTREIYLPAELQTLAEAEPDA